jgi:hypothetical protein
MEQNSRHQDPGQDDGPRKAPETDPTNPCRQESAGVWTRAEEENERRLAEPGLTDRDRQLRGI